MGCFQQFSPAQLHVQKWNKFTLQYKCTVLFFCHQLNTLLEINVWKSWKHSSAGIVFFDIWTKSANVALVYTTSCANIFLFFTGKEWTNMAAPWRAESKPNKYFCCMNIGRTTLLSLQTKLFAHFFTSFWDNLPRIKCPSPLNHKIVHRTWSLPRALAVVCFSQKRQFPFTCLMYSQWVMDVKKNLAWLKVRHKEHVLADCWWHKQVTKTKHYCKVNTHHLKNVIARHNTGLIMALSVQDEFTSKSNLLSSMFS